MNTELAGLHVKIIEKEIRRKKLSVELKNTEQDIAGDVQLIETALRVYIVRACVAYNRESALHEFRLSEASEFNLDLENWSFTVKMKLVKLGGTEPLGTLQALTAVVISNSFKAIVNDMLLKDAIAFSISGLNFPEEYFKR